MWFNAAARQLTPSLDTSQTSTCTAGVIGATGSCTLYLSSGAGVLTGDTVSGAWFVDGSTTATMIQDKMTVTAVSANGSIVTVEPPMGTMVTTPGTITLQEGSASSTMFLKNVDEFACLYDHGGTYCSNPGLVLSSNVGTHISVIEVTDDSLRSTVQINAAYAGGQAGFNKLLQWMNPSNGISLAIVIGAPVSYYTNAGTAACNTAVSGTGSALSYGSATDKGIGQVVSSLGTAIGSLGLDGSTTLTIQLDLDEPINHAYDNFVGNSGTGQMNAPKGGFCTLDQLALLESSILATYQQHWETMRGTMALPHITFTMGDDEAPAAVYNAPTFKNGDGECGTEGDVECFVDRFHADAMSVTFTVTAHSTTNTYHLLPEQQHLQVPASRHRHDGERLEAGR